MVSRIKHNIPSGLDAEYKEQLKQSARNNNPASKVINIKAGIFKDQSEDIVTLSLARMDTG
ncbi:MAG: hypothetical protein WCP33_00100 [Deltaproteobacteria bacterium]